MRYIETRFYELIYRETAFYVHALSIQNQD